MELHLGIRLVLVVNFRQVCDVMPLLFNNRIVAITRITFLGRSIEVQLYVAICR